MSAYARRRRRRGLIFAVAFLWTGGCFMDGYLFGALVGIGVCVWAAR